MITNRTDAIHHFNTIVLEAMDRAANDIFGENIHTNCAGATDADLPTLLPHLERHLDVLAKRYHCRLTDNGLHVNVPAWSKR